MTPCSLYFAAFSPHFASFFTRFCSTFTHFPLLCAAVSMVEDSRLCIKIMNFVLMTMNFVLKISMVKDSVEQLIAHGKVCLFTENDEICTKHDEICTKNDDFRVKKDGFCIKMKVSRPSLGLNVDSSGRVLKFLGIRASSLYFSSILLSSPPLSFNFPVFSSIFCAPISLISPQFLCISLHVCSNFTPILLSLLSFFLHLSGGRSAGLLVMGVNDECLIGNAEIMENFP